MPTTEGASGWRPAVLARLDAWFEPVLVFLALLSVPLLLAGTGDLGPGDRRIIGVASWVIYAGFAVNLVVRMAIDPHRRRALGRLRWDVLVVVGQPALALAHVGLHGLGVALFRLVAVAARTATRGGVVRRTWRRLVDHPFQLLAGVVPYLWLLCASLALRADRAAGTDGIQSIGDALWWAAATMSTVGYGDISPKSPLGRLAGGLTMLVGIGAFSVLTAKLAERLLAARDASGHIDADVADHTVVLGWSAKLPTIVGELVTANASRPAADLVVVCEQPKVDVERDCHQRVPGLARSTTRLTCRTGSTCDPTDVARGRPDLARSILVADDGTNPTGVVMALLALLHGPRPPKPGVPIVVEVQDAAAAASVRRAFGGRVLVVEPARLLARITAQSCRQPGLGLAYEELLNFGGSELYVHADARLHGRRFADLVAAFPTACPVGVVTAEDGVELAPSGDRLLGDGERLLLLGVDDSALDEVELTRAAPVQEPADRDGCVVPEVTRFVVLGWNDLGARVLSQLDEQLAPGSTVTVLVDRDHCVVPGPIALRQIRLAIRDIGAAEYADEIQQVVGAGCDHVVVLSERGLPTREADGRALLATMHAERAAGEGGLASLVTELRDEQDVRLARQATAGEFIISDRLASLLMAQLAESPALAAAFDALLGAAGAELYSLPAEWYAPLGRPVAFSSVSAIASRRGEMALGWRIAAEARAEARRFGLTMNPPKSAAVTFVAGDRVVVLADPTRNATGELAAAPVGLVAP